MEDDSNEITLEETVEVQDRLIQKYERQIKNLDQKISSLELENKKITEKMEEYKAITDDKEAECAITVEQQEENITRMNAKINQLMKEIEMKDEKIQQLETDMKEVSENSFSKEKQLGSLEERNNYLSQELTEKKEENLNLQEELKAAQTENNRLSNEIARVLGNLEGTRDKMSLDETKVNELQAQTFDLNELLKAKDSEIEDLKSLNADNITKIADLEKNIKDLSDLDIQSQEIRTDLENKSEILESQCKTLEDQLAQLEQSLAEKNKEYEELEQIKNSFEDLAKEQQELHVGTIKGRDKIIEYIKEQLPQAVSRLFITTPSIMDLKPIVDEIPILSGRIQIRIATHINPEINQHNAILTRLKEIGDVSVRNFIKEDRWCIERDSAEVMLAHGGIDPVGIILQDPDFITLIRNFITEPWITSR